MRVEPHRLETRARNRADHEVGIRLEAVDQFRCRRITAEEVDVAGLDRRADRLGIGDRHDRDLVENRAIGVVIVLVALENDALAELVEGDLERPGADRRQTVLRITHGFEGTPADQGHGAARRPLEGLDHERRLGRAEDHLDRIVVDLDHVVDVGQHPRVDRLFGVLRTVVGEHHVVGGERVAVVELHPLAQVEDILLAIVGHAPAAGGVGLGDEIRVDVGQPAEHVRGDLELDDLVHARRIEGYQFVDA